MLALHLTGAPQVQIARVVDADRSTVRRDLAWIKENWDDALGRTPHLDPDSMLGKMVACVADHEQRALDDVKRWREESADRRVSETAGLRASNLSPPTFDRSST